MREEDISQLEEILERLRKPQKKISLTEVVKENLDKLKASGASEKSLYSKQWFLDVFIGFAESNNIHDIQDIESKTLDLFFLKLREKNYKQNYLKNYHTHIKSVFNFAKERNYIYENPFDNAVKISCEITIIDGQEWNDKDYYSLIDYLNSPKYIESFNKKAMLKSNLIIARNKAIISIIYRAGIRIGKLLRVRIKNIDISGPYPTIRTTKKIRSTSNRIKEDIFIITENQAIKHLIDLIQLFEGQDENIRPFKISQKNFRQALEKMFDAINRPYKSPHMGKHGFITKSIELGINDGAIMKMTGNVSPQIFQRYKHAKIKNIADLYAKAYKTNKVDFS